MKRYFLTNVFIVIIICLLLSSCKDTTHYPHPSPGGVRLASYSFVGTSSRIVSPGVTATQNANYAFFYDSLNRVSFVTFSTNDIFSSNEYITYTYGNDTIYKKITSLNPAFPIENDTFLVNSQGQITVAFTPNTTTSFQYYENLLTRVTVTNESTLTSVSTSYTSVVNDFINSLSSVSTIPEQNFLYYTDYTNRIADYYQLQSFTMYGQNIYQYNHLIRQVTQGTQTMNLTYNIDAYSNIVQETASVTNTTGSDTSTVYNFQYESY